MPRQVTLARRDAAGPMPGPGEVRVRLTMSGAHPGDVKKRQSPAGLADGVRWDRVAQRRRRGHRGGRLRRGPGPGGRVWVYEAQSCRPFGAAVQATVVSQTLTVDLPDAASDQMGGVRRHPGHHRALGGVPRRARLRPGCARARCPWLGEPAGRSTGPVGGRDRDWRRPHRRRDRDLGPATWSCCSPAPIRRLAPGGAGRIVEVALSANADLDAEVTRNSTVIAGYAGPKDRRPDWGRETAGGLPKHRRATYNRLGVACLGHRVKAVVGRRSGLTQLGDAGSSTRSGGRSGS